MLVHFTRRTQIIDTQRIMHFCPIRIDQSFFCNKLSVRNFHSTHQAPVHRSHPHIAQNRYLGAAVWRPCGKISPILSFAFLFHRSIACNKGRCDKRSFSSHQYEMNGSFRQETSSFAICGEICASSFAHGRCIPKRPKRPSGRTPCTFKNCWVPLDF